MKVPTKPGKPGKGTGKPGKGTGKPEHEQATPEPVKPTPEPVNPVKGTTPPVTVAPEPVAPVATTVPERKQKKRDKVAPAQVLIQHNTAQLAAEFNRQNANDAASLRSHIDSLTSAALTVSREHREERTNLQRLLDESRLRERTLIDDLSRAKQNQGEVTLGLALIDDAAKQRKQKEDLHKVILEKMWPGVAQMGKLAQLALLPMASGQAVPPEVIAQIIGGGSAKGPPQIIEARVIDGVGDPPVSVGFLAHVLLERGSPDEETLFDKMRLGLTINGLTLADEQWTEAQQWFAALAAQTEKKKEEKKS